MKNAESIWPSDNAHESNNALMQAFEAIEALKAANAGLQDQLTQAHEESKTTTPEPAPAPKRTYTKADKLDNLRKGREKLAHMRANGIAPKPRKRKPEIVLPAPVQTQIQTAPAPVRQDYDVVNGVKVWNPNAPAKTRQTWSVFVYTGQDVRSMGLTKLECVKLIARAKAEGAKAFGWKQDAKNAAKRETFAATRAVVRRAKRTPKPAPEKLDEGLVGKIARAIAGVLA